MATLVAIAVPAFAVGDDSTAPGGPPAPAPLGPGLEVGKSVSLGVPNADEPEDPATAGEIAASASIYDDATADESRRLLAQQFSEQLLALDQIPGRAAADVERFFSDTVARVDPPGTGGPELLVSTTPLRDKTDGGAVRPVDLGIEGENGHFEAQNPLADVSLPADATGPIRLQDAKVGIRLVSGDESQPVASQLDGDKLFYHEVAPATDLVLAPVTQGTEFLAQIRSADSPERLSFQVELPPNAQLNDAGEEGLEVVHASDRIALITRPLATDAQGVAVATQLVQTGPASFDLVVEHRSSAALYPVLVDPLFEDWYYNSWAWGGNRNFSGWSTYPNVGWWNLATSPTCWWYCWGPTGTPGYDYGAYIHAGQGWQIPSGAYNEWYYTVPGNTTFISSATFYPMYLARGTENNWSTPYAFWGLYSAADTWTGWGATGTGMTGGSQTFWPGTPPSYVRTHEAVFGMANNYDRTGANKLTANRSAALGGIGISIDDPESPSIPELVHMPGAPSFSSWLPEGNGVTAYQSEVLADAPSLYWRLGETSGITAADTSGHDRTGTYWGQSGPPTLNAHAVVAEDPNQGGAVDLDGASQLITAWRPSGAYNPFVNGTVHTFEGWANRDSSSTFDMLVAGRSPDATAPYLAIAGDGYPSTDVYWSPRGDASFPSRAIWANAWPGSDQWVHWALVFDEANDTAELFVNGESKGTRSVPSPYSSTTGEFIAGSWVPLDNGFLTGPFDGKLDEIAVYDHRVSAARLRSHYAKGPSGIGWVYATASDPGVGVQSFKLTYTKESGEQAELTDPNVPGCPGGTRSMTVCYSTWGAQFPYNAYNASGGPLPEGISTLTLTATDALRKSTSRAFDAKVDRSYPVPHLSGGLYSPTQPGYALQVAATDVGTNGPTDRANARSGMRRIDLYIDRGTNSNPLATTGNQPCTASLGSCPLSLNYTTFNPAAYSEGSHHFEVVATDQLGHEQSEEWDEFVDNTPPAVTDISGPATEDWLTGGTTSISVTARNAGTGVQKIDLDMPGASGVEHLEHAFSCDPHCPQAPTASWSIPVSQLAEGAGTLAAKAYGPSGIAGSPQSETVRVDRTPATVEADGPTGWLTGGTAAITVSAQNPGAGVDNMTLDLPGGGQLSHFFDCSPTCPEEVTHEFQFDVTELPNGEANGVARAYGPGGVSSVPAAGPIKIDYGEPVLESTGRVFDVAGAIVSEDEEFTLDVDDLGSGVESVVVSVDGAEVTRTGIDDYEERAQECEAGLCNFSTYDWVDLAGIESGEHSVELRVLDAAGHTASATNTVILDRQAPGLDIGGDLASFDGQLLSTEAVNASISAADESGLATVVVKVDEQEVARYPTTDCTVACPQQINETYAYAKADWGAGPHEVTFTATDVAGNENREAITVDAPPAGEPLPECPSSEPVAVDPVDTLSAASVSEQVAQESESPLAPNVPGVDPETGVPLDPNLILPNPEAPSDPSIRSSGNLTPEATSDDPAAGFTVGDVVCLRPTKTTTAETEAFLVEGEGGAEAAVYANSAPQTDTLYRPTPIGAALVLNFRGPEAPTRFRWNVELEPGEEIEQLADGGLAIVDTTAADQTCVTPPAPEDGTEIETLGDTEVQLQQSRHDLCVAQNDVTSGVVEAVVAPPVAADQAGDPVPVTLHYVQIPDVPPYIEIEMPEDPPAFPSKRKRKGVVRFSAGFDANDCGKTKPSPCGNYGTHRAVNYALRWGGAGNYDQWINLDFGGGDCTNFMSQILLAGGMNFMREPQRGTGSWWTYPVVWAARLVRGHPDESSQSWTVADTLARHLWQYGLVDPIPVADPSSHSPGEFQTGDLVALEWLKEGTMSVADGMYDHFQYSTGWRVGPNGGVLEPGMAQHGSVDYARKPWSGVLYRIQNENEGHHGQVNEGWRIRLLRPVHTKANVSKPVRSWGAF